MLNEENKKVLVNFISQKIKEGASSTEIKNQLVQIGWSIEDVNLAYTMALTENNYSSAPLPNYQSNSIYSSNQIVKDSSNKKTVKTGETAINMLSFVALSFFVTSLGTLCFSVINYLFKDVVSDNSYYSSYSNKYIYQTINYAVAVILVAFPIYFLSVRFWLLVFKKDFEKEESSLTKFVTYLFLIVSVVVLAGDLVTIIYKFLQGELTQRFFLKSFTVFVLSSGIFGFYYFERKRVQYKKEVSSSIFYSFAVLIVTFTIISIIVAFSVTGSPSTQRERAFDEVRSNKLEDIKSCVRSYYNFNKNDNSLKNIKDLEIVCSSDGLKDPSTNQYFEYKLLDEKNIEEKRGANNFTVYKNINYELCANFSLANEGIEKKLDANYIDYTKHPEGRYCFKDSVKIEQSSSTHSIYQNSMQN